MRILGGCALAALVAAVSLGPAQASQAQSVNAGGAGIAVQAHEYCVVVVEKLQPGAVQSKVANKVCSPNANDAQLQQILASSTSLIRFWEKENYQGYYTTVTGKSGPCDLAGYGFRDLRGVNEAVGGITSYQYYNGCNAQQYWDGINYGGATRENVSNNPNIGDPWNDSLNSMKVWNLS